MLEVFFLNYYIVWSVPADIIQQQHQFSSATIIDLTNLCRKTILYFVLGSSQRIGGPNKTVEMDERVVQPTRIQASSFSNMHNIQPPSWGNNYNNLTKRSFVKHRQKQEHFNHHLIIHHKIQFKLSVFIILPCTWKLMWPQVLKKLYLNTNVTIWFNVQSAVNHNTFLTD